MARHDEQIPGDAEDRADQLIEAKQNQEPGRVRERRAERVEHRLRNDDQHEEHRNRQHESESRDLAD